MNKSNDILRDSGVVSADLMARIEATGMAARERCYQHPESPTGYVGRGKWCDHKRAALARAK